MIKLLIKALTAPIPNKKLRKKLRTLLSFKLHCLDMSVYEIYMNSVWNKHRQLEKNSQKIDTLILGDSHAQLGVLPAIMGEGAFNYAFCANSLYEDYCCLKKALELCPKIKKVILVLSFYNGGYCLVRTSTAWRCRVLESLLGFKFDYSLNQDFNWKFWNKVISRAKIDEDFFTSQGYDFTGQRIIANQKKVSEKVEKHYGLYQKYHNQWKILEDICDLCRECSIELYFTNSPVRFDYQEHLNHLSNAADVYAPIMEIAERKQVKFLRIEDAFEPEDFADTDHLNFNGAVKFSRLIQQKAG